MTLPGKAFLALWHDIEPASQTEYMEWHTREHMPERLSIPGFLVGKRLIGHERERYRYGTVYTGENVDVFRSPAYLERLNNPTEWSGRVQPTFRNFLRVACNRLASAGTGDGGAMATIRLTMAEGDHSALEAGAQGLCDALLKVTGAACTHVGAARSEVSDIRTRETDMRPGMTEKGFDALVLIEGSGKPELEASLPEFHDVIAHCGLGLSDPQTIVYNLAYTLTAADMAAAG
ncbi:hypothetical protein [Oceanicola sp. 502str15]|uniref:hypothetical protein n=1 Tax=Oceanicola sp. 502str15 TaxID=2696061 RepID=UPI0020948AE0|nr:hypothetical protein [Oceanicola sp. 502str15]MCO6384385.1 hypothetical protein [Oceanicola sp. 502str15]